MNGWSEQERQEYKVVDAALRDDSLVPAPRTLAPGVMERIGQLTPAPKFRLLWMDYALGVFGVALAAVMISLWQGLLPFELLNLVQLAVFPLNGSSLLPWVLSLAAGVVLVVVCGAIAVVVLKPRPDYRVSA